MASTPVSHCGVANGNGPLIAATALTHNLALGFWQNTFQKHIRP
jgi:hypothetical protein